MTALTWDMAAGSVLWLHGILSSEPDTWLYADFWYRNPGTWPEIYFDDSAEVWIYPSGAGYDLRGTHKLTPVPEPQLEMGLAVACGLIAGVAALRRRIG